MIHIETSGCCAAPSPSSSQTSSAWSPRSETEKGLVSVL